MDNLQARLLGRYLELLAHWNRTMNLTGVPLEGFPDSSLDRLAVEPMLAAPFMPLTSIDWCDLGSGGGSPAIPLKILRPLASLTMVESRSRKAAFLREAVRTLELPNAHVAEARFQDLARDCPGAADLVTVRAVKRDATLRSAVTTLLRPGGRLLAFGSRATQGSWAGLALVESRERPGSDDVLEILAKEPT